MIFSNLVGVGSRDLKLFRSPAPQHNFCSLKDDGQIQQQREVLYVKQIKFEFDLGFFQSGAVLVLHLGPSCKTGSYHVPLIKERNFFLQQLAEIWNLRTRSDQAHLSAQNVEQLWQLIQSEFPDETAQPRNARIAIFGPPRPALFRALPHGTEFQDLEGSPAQPNPLLAEKYRPSTLHQNGNRHRNHQRQRQGNQDQGNRKIKRSLACKQKTGFAEAVGKNQPARSQLFHHDAPGQAFINTLRVFDGQSLQL